MHLISYDEILLEKQDAFVKHIHSQNAHFAKKFTFIFHLHKRKGLGTRNTHVNYESSITYHSKVMANVKDFCRHIEKQTDRVKTVSPLSIYIGHKNVEYTPTFLHS